MSAKILLLNPNKWGRGITFIWIPSHTALLREQGHQVKLFDCTFYKDWTVNEVAFNTENKQYKPTEYESLVTYKEQDILQDLKSIIEEFSPAIIFWSALSSHIHGEGEYVNIQYGHHLMEQLKPSAIKIAGGLQPTADPHSMVSRYPQVDYFIQGESEFVLAEIANHIDKGQSFTHVKGLVYQDSQEVKVNPPQPIISDMDTIPPYDYSVFEPQVFLRPYNGEVLRAVDYELSRGCLYSCSYCVETVIQRYYGFEETTARGALLNAKFYLRNKSAQRVFQEWQNLHQTFGISLIRCQDTNFLTIDREVLTQLAQLMDEAKLPLKLYIETRPEGINAETVKLLKRLKVDGVGMGLELASQDFREDQLHRFSNQEKIEKAFQLLRKNGIKRTSYNIIGLPDETEEMILKTIEFNRKLDPDNMTVAFYSPYIGTNSQREALKRNDFHAFEFDVDGQIRSLSRSSLVSKETLDFYKRYFVTLVRGEKSLEQLKREWRLSDG